MMALMRRQVRRAGCAWMLVTGLVALQPPSALASAPGPHLFEVRLDNDSFTGIGPDERWYTSGAFLRAWRRTDATRWWMAGLGQQLYTPAQAGRSGPPSGDRPFAGLLFAEAAVGADDGASAHALVLRLGVVGPRAQGEATQNRVHRLLDQRPSGGWPWQVAERDILQFDLGGAAAHRLGPRLDVVGHAGVDAGNLLVAARAGAIARWGSLPAAVAFPDEPLPVGTRGLRSGDAYLYAGARLRAVHRNRLIDGRTNGYDNPAMPRRWVASMVVGTTMVLDAQWRLDLALTLQERDFRIPDVPLPASHRVGTIRLVWEG
jgi:lipid A 3-O-deacylase